MTDSEFCAVLSYYTVSLKKIKKRLIPSFEGGVAPLSQKNYIDYSKNGG
jgi:hypothetical protein